MIPISVVPQTTGLLFSPATDEKPPTILQLKKIDGMIEAWNRIPSFHRLTANQDTLFLVPDVLLVNFRYV